MSFKTHLTFFLLWNTKRVCHGRMSKLLSS